MIEQEKTIFNNEKRAQYLQETTESLKALLDDAFLGEDQNEIKSEFPPNSTRNDIKIESYKTSLTYINDSIEPIIEIAIQISFEKTPIGEYKSVYDLFGELQDELFFLE